MQGYHMTTVKPTLAASLQHSAAYSADDVLWDWTNFDAFSKPGRLLGCTALVRGTDGVRQEFAFDMYFSKSSSFSIGNSNSAVSMQPNNDLLAAANMAVTHYMDGLNTMEVANMTTSNRVSVITPPINEIKAGNTTPILYIAGVAQGAFDFRTTCRINNGSNYAADSSSTIIIDGSSGIINFAPGDVLHAHDDAVIGTVKTVTANLITLTGNNTAALLDDDYVYNIHPITLHLAWNFTR